MCLWRNNSSNNLKIFKRHLKAWLPNLAGFLPLSLFYSESKTRNLLCHWVEPFAPSGTALSSSLQKCSKLLSHVLPLEDGPRISLSWQLETLFSTVNGFWHQCFFCKCIVSLNGSFPSLTCTPWYVCRQQSSFPSASKAMLRRLLS